MPLQKFRLEDVICKSQRQKSPTLKCLGIIGGGGGGGGREAGVFDYLLPPHQGAFGGLHPKKNRLIAEPGGGGGGYCYIWTI